MFLSQWFPNKKRVQMFAIFYLAQPFSQMLGAPLSGGLISFGDTLTPWHGWQVMFFVEGVMAIVAGVAAYFLLTDSPQKATWLDEREKAAMREVMAHEDTVRDADGPRGIVPAMLNGKVWYFTVIYFCLQVAVYGTTFYLPQQVGRPARARRRLAGRTRRRDPPGRSAWSSATSSAGTPTPSRGAATGAASPSS
jgi:sugar phosphate permease